MSGKNPKKTARRCDCRQSQGPARLLHRDTFEAGLVLEGWEVKSLRAGNIPAQRELCLHPKRRGMAVWRAFVAAEDRLDPRQADPTRSRKLLLHRKELDRLTVPWSARGYALVPLDLHWHKGRAKLTVGVAKGKKQHDKRAANKDRDWQRQKARILKGS